MRCWLLAALLTCLAATAAEAQRTPKIQDKINRQSEVTCNGRDITALQERIGKMEGGALKAMATDEFTKARGMLAAGDMVGCTLHLRAAINAVDEQGGLPPPP